MVRNLLLGCAHFLRDWICPLIFLVVRSILVADEAGVKLVLGREVGIKVGVVNHVMIFEGFLRCQRGAFIIQKASLFEIWCLFFA